MSEPRTCAIGLDIGGTKIAGGVVAFPSGTLLTRRIVATDPGRGGAAVLGDAVAVAGGVDGEGGEEDQELLGIGIGGPELGDPAGGNNRGHRFDWRDLPVAERFGRLAPTMIESDVRAAAFAEAL